ncbi:hypothetical protein FMM05_04315 [Flavobacterium zepuense]|uniref:Lipoprotein n=1 Tax=Flavobacterium zepuense TaxID=2593302 RepID=A0A552V825_9FLAO|nr:NPP1 family protein [Flavobacterium zepuense]TRW26606.1 hypothetical protein FMM05_04315 [Flavobacterium zepuense]
MKNTMLAMLALAGVMLFSCSAPSINEIEETDEIMPDTTANGLRLAATVNTNAFLSCGCTESTAKITTTESATWATTFAPLVKFDRAAPDYPTSVEDIWASTNPGSIVCNGQLQLTNSTAPTSLNFPTYYDVQQHPTDADKVFIDYWFTYKKQEPCSAGQGGHDYDWEHIVIQFKKSTQRIVTVTYYQHGGWYTIDWRNKAAGTRVVAFVGKYAHGMYNNSNTISFIGYACTYFGDYRNPADATDEASTWNNLVRMTCDKTEFNFNGGWGTTGKGPLHRDRQYWNFAACNGSDTFGTNGCSGSDFAVGTIIGTIN